MVPHACSFAACKVGGKGWNGRMRVPAPANLLRSADDSGPLWNMLCSCSDGIVSNDARPAALPRAPAASAMLQGKHQGMLIAR